MRDRHGRELSDFVSCMQVMLNKHRDKPDLDTLSIQDISAMVTEEDEELHFDLWHWETLPGGPRRIQMEAIDLAIAAFAAWLKGRYLDQDSLGLPVRPRGPRWYEGEE